MRQSIIERPALESEILFAHRPLAQLRGVRMAHFTERPFPQLFEEQAAQNPASIAVTCESASLTSGELNARANQLARHLRARGQQRPYFLANSSL